MGCRNLLDGRVVCKARHDGCDRCNAAVRCHEGPGVGVRFLRFCCDGHADARAACRIHGEHIIGRDVGLAQRAAHDINFRPRGGLTGEPGHGSHGLGREHRARLRDDQRDDLVGAAEPLGDRVERLALGPLLVEIDENVRIVGDVFGGCEAGHDHDRPHGNERKAETVHEPGEPDRPACGGCRGALHCHQAVMLRLAVCEGGTLRQPQLEGRVHEPAQQLRDERKILTAGGRLSCEVIENLAVLQPVFGNVAHSVLVIEVDRENAPVAHRRALEGKAPTADLGDVIESLTVGEAVGRGCAECEENVFPG